LQLRTTTNTTALPQMRQQWLRLLPLPSCLVQIAPPTSADSYACCLRAPGRC
jgi:hypothetical protein